MINGNISDAILQIVKDDKKVLDVGGGRNPWARADYVIDRRSYSERVGDVAEKEKIGKIHFNEKTWISWDFYDLPWPVEDKFFDFVVCMDTLEDLRDPILICKELQRIGKAGYISTPTRSLESCVHGNTSPLSDQLVGYFHHRWFVEIEKGALIFKMKNPMLYQHKNLIITEVPQKTLNFFWCGSFNFEERYLANNEDAYNDVLRYKDMNDDMVKAKNHDQIFKTFNYIPDEFKQISGYLNF